MSEPAEPLASKPRRSGLRGWLFIGGIIGAVVVSLLVIRPDQRPPAPPASDQELPEGVSAAHYAKAEAAFARTFRRPPDREDTFMLLGELAVRDEKLEIAASCFQQIRSTHSRYGSSARFQQSQILLRLNRAAEAETGFREFLAMAEADSSIEAEHVVMARKWLTFILSVELRFEDRKPFLQQAHTAGRADIYDSEQLYFPTLLIWNSSVGRARLRDFLKADPLNQILLTANTRYLIGEGRLDEAEEVLTELRRQQPNNPACLAAALQCAYEQADWDRMGQLLEDAPGVKPDESWLMTEMRGEFSLYERNWQQAIDHFQRLLKHDPANPVCHMGLAKAYAGLGMHDERKAVQERSLLLSKIRVDLSGITSETGAAIRSVAESCRQLGLDEAAATFERHAKTTAESAQ